jgi:virginiamycin B lyase
MLEGCGGHVHGRSNQHSEGNPRPFRALSCPSLRSSKIARSTRVEVRDYRERNLDGPAIRGEEQTDMTRSFLESTKPFRSNLACVCATGALLAAVACGSDDAASGAQSPAGTEAPAAEGDTPAGMNPASSGNTSTPATETPSAGGGENEANAGLGEQTPLAPNEMPAPGANEMPPAAVDPGSLEVVEIAIPDDLPGCSPAYPHDPAVDLETGMVYYAGSNESCIGQYNPDTGEFQAWPTATPNSYPHGLLVVDGVVFFTGQRADLIGSVDPATGEAVDFPVAADGPHTAVLHEGGIWFTVQGSSEFGRLDPATGEADVFAFSGGPAGPYGIWPAPDGSLWVALFATNRLARIDVAASPPTEEQFVLPETDSRPRRIAVDASGRVWFTDFARSALGSLDPALPEGERVREFPTPGGGRPYGIAIGPDGRVWYNDQDSAEMVGFDPATDSVVARLPIEIDNPGPVRNIAVDQPRRRLWLAISNVGQLAMIQF